VPTADQIVQAAAELFMELGYRAVTMEKVAERSGVTKAAVYYHFADKAALLTTALVALFGRVRASSEAILERDEPLRLRLLALAQAILRLPEPLTRVELLLRVARDDLSEDQLAAIAEASDAVGAAVAATMREGVRRGEIRDVDPLLLGHMFIDLVRVGHARAADGTPLFPDPERGARTFVDILWNGVGAGGAASTEEDALGTW
jgi:AcrR family transcriptional regulator